MAFLPGPFARKYLTAPTQEQVDLRAACFCHRRIVDIGYVCSVCLSSTSSTRSSRSMALDPFPFQSFARQFPCVRPVGESERSPFRRSNADSSLQYQIPDVDVDAIRRWIEDHRPSDRRSPAAEKESRRRNREPFLRFSSRRKPFRLIYCIFVLLQSDRIFSCCQFGHVAYTSATCRAGRAK